jgi:hypothetical protein
MSECNGLKIRALNPDCSRIAVKSSVQTTWMMTYKKHSILSKPKEYDVGFDKNELLVLSFQDGSGGAVIEIEPLGDNVGTIIAQSSRKTTRTLRVGGKYRYELDPGESIVIRGSKIIHPNTPGAGLSV